MRLVVVTALAALLLPSAALAAGPSYVAQGGVGVLARDGKHRFVAVSTGGATAIERISVRGGAVTGWAVLRGAFGIPQPTMSSAHLEGLTRDGRSLLVGSAAFGRPTTFAVLDTRTFRVRERIELDGSFAYDALSPDGKTLYLTRYVDRNTTSRYGDGKTWLAIDTSSWKITHPSRESVFAWSWVAVPLAVLALIGLVVAVRRTHARKEALPQPL